MEYVAAVTGATGFIGWHLASYLRDRGWRVRGIVRPESRRALPAGIERVTAALRERQLIAACSGASVIFHLAAVLHGPSRRELDAVNVDGTREVVNAAAAIGARLVHISSLGAAGPSPADRPREEDDPPSPVNAYGASKLAAEQVVQQAHVWWTILRPTLVFGPRDRLFLPVFRLARRGFVVPPPNRLAVYNLVHVDDVVRAIGLAAQSESARGRIMFIGHHRHVTRDDWAPLLSIATGRRCRTLAVPAALLPVAAALGGLAERFGAERTLDRDRLAELLAEGFSCSTERARRLIGFEAAVTLEDGFQSVARWYAEQQWL